MSRNVDALFIDFFDSEVKRAYGDYRVLGDKVYTKSNIEGSTCRFQKKGKGMATRHNPGSDVTAMNTDFSSVVCTLESWEAFDYADKFEGKQINFAEVTELAEVAADAIGLRMDQIIIDALGAGYDATGAGLTADNYKVGTTNTALSVDTLRLAKARLDEKGVPSTERFFSHTSNMLNRDLLSEEEVTSSDFNTIRALVSGELNTFLGFSFVMIAERQEGGLPFKNTTTDKMGYIWHKRAVGQAIGMNMETEMTWIPEKRAYFVGAEFMSSSIVIDDLGVVGVLAKA